jgi:threonine synthase
MLTALRESHGGAIAVSDEALMEGARELQVEAGIDAAPEGGATLAAARGLTVSGAIRPHETVVLFNTGAGWLYRT